jgi:imidazolonepropionase-like amidohydrolase
MLVVRGATVVDADGTREADVAIEDGHVAAVEAPGSVADADRELTVEGYLAPGLVDAHVHVSMNGRPDPAGSYEESDYTTAFHAANNLEDAVRAGVTTVRDLGSRGSLAIDAADAVAEGSLTGPRVLAAGQAITMTGGHGNEFGREADGTAEVRKAAREQLKRGADVLKCMATGGVLTEGAVTGAPELTEDEIDAMVEVADSKGVPTAAHAHGAAGIKNATRAGITSVEHGTFMDREAAELMASRDTYWVPTLKALYGIVDNGVDSGIPDWAVAKGEEAGDAIEDAFEYALDAGVPIAMGTDAGTPFNYHRDAAEELELMVDHGVDPRTAFEAATVNGADLLGVEDTGLVREGYRADLVALDSDPTEDETAYRDPGVVIADGEVIEGWEAITDR